MGRPALGLSFVEMVADDYESDRSYSPYVQEGHSARLWYYPDQRLELASGEAVDPFGTRPLPRVWSTARGSWLKRDTVLQAMPALHRFSMQTRPLNAWAVLADWLAGPAPKVTGRCVVRDFPRMRLSRPGLIAEEQLYLAPASGLPVEYDLIETDPLALWGHRSVAYVYSNWVPVGGALFPMASFRIVDGEIHISRTAAPLEADSAAPSIPSPVLSDTTDMRLAGPPPATAPDTVRVSDRTFVLHTRSYSNVVTLARDTVFLLDAQWNGEERARQDSTWIARLFPGRHPVVLVVSDLAWPHIAGVRTWVAMGARVVAHRSAAPFLTRVVNRRWSGAPDLLERRRAAARLRLTAVDDSLILGGGQVRIHPINGIGSEGALMTWLPGDRFLYAGDYVQGLSGPSMAYAREVLAASRRVHAEPERFAAMHMPLTGWSRLLEALAPAGLGAVGSQLDLDPASLTPGRDSLTVLLRGTPAGYQVTSLERSGAGFRFTERTEVRGMMSQETEVRLDEAGRAGSVRHVGHMPSGEMRIVLDYAEGRVKGTVQPPEASTAFAVDTVLPPGTIDDNALFPLFGALKWREGASWTFPIYVSGKRRLETRTLAVRAVEPVLLNGRPVPAFRADLGAEGRTVTFYIQRSAPHRVLRIVPVGTPIEFLAAE